MQKLSAQRGVDKAFASEQLPAASRYYQVIQKSMSLKYETALAPLHIFVK